MFPTNVCESLVKASKLDSLFEGATGWRIPLGQYQRLSLVSEHDTAFKAVAPLLTSKPDDQQMLAFKLIGTMVKSDALSLAMEQLIDMAESARSEKERLAAATVVNELFGEKQLIEDVKLTDKLMINLVNSG